MIDGYPIQWLRSAIPSNTLACLNALAEDARQRQVLGPGVDIRLHTYDETNRRVRPERIIRTIRKAGGKALIGMVGVQSNQFPRAVDLARPFLAAGLPVCIGGFHVSGCIAMLPELPADIREAQAARHLAVCRRGGGAPARRGAARCLERRARSRSTITWTSCRRWHGEPPPILPRKHVAPHLRLAFQHRSRPRLPLSMLVLHHHQRAGPQEPVPLARRSRADRARELRRRASSASSSPTTISPATATGSRCSTG